MSAAVRSAAFCRRRQRLAFCRRRAGFFVQFQSSFIHAPVFQRQFTLSLDLSDPLTIYRVTHIFLW